MATGKLEKEVNLVFWCVHQVRSVQHLDLCVWENHMKKTLLTWFKENCPSTGAVCWFLLGPKGKVVKTSDSDGAFSGIRWKLISGAGFSPSEFQLPFRRKIKQSMLGTLFVFFWVTANYLGHRFSENVESDENSSGRRTSLPNKNGS